MSELSVARKTMHGRVREIHKIKEFEIIEYVDGKGDTWYYPFVDEKPLYEHFSNIYEALLHCIAVYKEGYQSKSGEYLCRILGIKSSI